MSTGTKAATKFCLFLVTLVVTGLLATSSIQAQQYLGTLSGSVSDATGAKIVGATVTAKDVTTNFETKVVTNGSGVYTIPFLTPDTYTVTVQARGFGGQSRTAIVLTAGAIVQTDFSLKAAGASTEITVTAETELLDTTSANLETTLETQEVTDTPNIGRNPFVLSTLAAGVFSAGSGGYMESKASTYTNPFSGVAIQVDTNGSSGHNRLTLDGVPDDPSERFSGASYTGFVPSPEAVQEVKVQTGIYDAQFGHGDGVVTNTVLRSGSNKYHGAAYDVFRNTYMNANTYERVPTQATTTHRSNDQWEQPGGVFDGPVRIPHVYNGHDKTFFTVAYEYIQLHATLPYQSLVPTVKGTNPQTSVADNGNLGGDFSNLCSTFNGSGLCTSGIQIYDPTSVASGTGNRTPFAYNIIPSNRINAAGAALLGYYPAPNSTYSSTVNYISSDTSNPNKYYSFVTRVDQQFSEKQHLDAKFFKAVLHQFQPNEGFPQAVGPTGYGYTVFRNNEGGSIEDSYVFSPTLVATGRFGVIYHPFGLVYPGNVFNLSGIGMSGTGLPYQSFPGTSSSDSYAGLAAGNTGQISEDTLGSTSLMIAKTIQKHSLRTGFEGNLSRYNVQNPQSGIGVFAFDRRFTQENSSGASGGSCPAPSCVVGSDTTSGNAMASLLLGYPSSGTYGNTIAFALEQKYMALYVQDDWRVSSKLTVNAGLRWDYESPFTERFNRLNGSFCTTCTNPLNSSLPTGSGLTLKGGVTFVNTSSSPGRFQAPQVYTHYQPRVGAAYQITPKLVARGGFGLVYYNTQDSPASEAAGFSNSTSYVATTNNVYPANILSNPWPSGVTLPTGSTLGLSTQLGQSVTYPDPKAVQPKMWQWSASLQIQLPGQLAVQLAYVGNKVSQLPINVNVNGLPASYMGTSATPLTSTQINALNASVTNPMAGLLSGSSLNGTNIQQYLLYVPYPEFTSVTDQYAPNGSALYNALQIAANKRLSHNFEIQGNFTWSKIMDQNYYLNPQQFGLTPTRVQDAQPNLLANLWGTYHFSELKSKPLVVREILGGWKLQGVLRAYNAILINNPGSVSSPGNAGGSQYGTSQTYTQLQNPKLGYRSYTRYFNTCYENSSGALVYTTVSGSGAIVPGCDSTNGNVPAFRANPSYTLNSIGPYMNLRELVHPLMDASLFKTFQIRGSLNFEIRGEFFNALNTPNFGVPGTTPGTSSYGIVTMTQQNDPRLTQLTARINF
ncbi:MAG: carboxypeptidase-like regulatory domain-containing protein [Terracidiphilus sp.]